MPLYYSDELLTDYIARYMGIEKGSLGYESIKEYVKNNPFGI